MIIFLSPTKTFTNKKALSTEVPYFYKETNLLVDKLKKLELIEIENNFKISKSLANKTHSYYKNFDYKYKAAFTYGGTVYKNLDVDSIPVEKLNNLYILSALYGILKANDAISEYRLDFTNNFITDLYSFWTSKISDYIDNNFKDKLLINLTSNEFTKLIDSNKDLITINFATIDNNEKLKSPSMMVKKYRGLMARELLLNDYKNLESIKSINLDGFTYDEQHSNRNLLLFTRKG